MVDVVDDKEKRRRGGYDYTRTERSARRAEKVLKEGGCRMTGWLDARHTQLRDSLLANGYAENKLEVVKRALREACEREGVVEVPESVAGGD